MLRTPRTVRPSAVARYLVPAALLLLTACSGKKEEIPYVERPVEQIYTEASNAIDNKNYTKAALLFDEVERQHPYSQWAVRAKLMSAYSHYEAMKYDDAIAALDGFIALHPGNRNAPYAYYLKALCQYERITDVRRDQSTTEEALKALNEVVRRFPTTPYARDAKLKIDLTRDHLAGKDMEVGRFYLNTGEYVAAIKRFRRVIDEYQTTSHVPEALHRMVEAYLALGIREEAQANAALLGHNYPGSVWYQDTYALMNRAARGEKPSFLTRAWDWMF
ncbi:outer membrane protein assembly factor BamD [Niveispirillum sp. BGYR6]|uniref:outer membrane protein assembly factor BamD n=1 Tax=Niveispirillum sp. BGYR6 TaxID=2971249 RepID=UPI0022B9BBD6|nr:outer membrane protein assembly factor BamD [Niveispirillum sp. BGYR6]MDG5494947.1 outer membrane protein assembly factor BamD [Niveispirillum sp. BGYR6]